MWLGKIPKWFARAASNRTIDHLVASPMLYNHYLDYTQPLIALWLNATPKRSALVFTARAATENSHFVSGAASVSVH